jgi:hypothetical protein
MKDLSKIVVGLLVVAFSLMLCGTVYAAPIQWSGNNHYYEAFAAPNGVTWFEAEAAATAAGGYLATITSAPENGFVFSLVNDQQFWGTFPGSEACTNAGPWLGGFQPDGSLEPGGNWQWVTGESFTYTNWESGEPNNLGISGANEEDRLHFFDEIASGAPPYRVSTWNDLDGSRNNPHGYVVEWNTNPIPEPASMLLIGSGLIGLAGLRKKLKSKL